MITLPVRQLDHYTTPGMPLFEMAGLLAAVAELRPEAIADGCPPMFADPTHDPRMR